MKRHVQNPPAPLKATRLVWEPCFVSLSPALPFYEVMLDIPASGPLPAQQVRTLVTPDRRMFLRVPRASHGGA